MSDWIPATVVDVTRQYYDDVGEVTTGTASVTYTRLNVSTTEYLQSDASSWSTSSYAFPATYVAGVGWQATLTVPFSAAGYYVTATMAISDPDFPPDSETHYVPTNTESQPGATIRT